MQNSIVVGDVVRSPFPFTDLSSGKSRPILLLSEVGMGDWIVCEITTRRQAGSRGVISIDAGDFLSGGLPRLSVARFDRLHALNESIFDKVYGRLTMAKTWHIKAAVRGLF